MIFSTLFGHFFKIIRILSYFFPRMPMVQNGISVMILTTINDATLVVFKNKWIRICCFLALSFTLLQHSSQFSHIVFLSGFIKSGPQKNSFISKKMPEIITKIKFIVHYCNIHQLTKNSGYKLGKYKKVSFWKKKSNTIRNLGHFNASFILRNKYSTKSMHLSQYIRSGFINSGPKRTASSKTIP